MLKYLQNDEHTFSKISFVKPRQITMADRQLKGLSGMLSLQFILGVTLTTLINYNPDKHSAVQITFLVLHIIVAVGLLAAAIARVVTSVRWNYLQTPSIIGLLSIIDAMVSGSIAASNGSNVAVWFMAMGFLAAFAAYGFSMGAISRLGTAKRV